MASFSRYFVILLLLFAAVASAQNSRVTSLTVGAGGITNASRYLQNAGDFSIVPLADHLFLGTDANGLLQPPTVAGSSLVGRGSLSGAGDPEVITLGSGLSMSGTTLSATGGGSVTLNPFTATNITAVSNLTVQAMGDALADGSPVALLTIRSHTNHNNKIHTPWQVAVGQGANGAGESNTVYGAGLNPFRIDSTKPGIYDVTENKFGDGATSRMEHYLRYDLPGVTTDMRLVMWEIYTNGTVSGPVFKCGDAFYVRDLANTVNLLGIGTSGANLGSHLMSGGMTVVGNVAHTTRSYFKMHDRGYVEWYNTTEALSYGLTVNADEKSLSFYGQEAGATNIIVTNLASAPMNLVIPNGSLQVGPTPAVITNVLMATASLDFGSIGGSTNADLAITVTGTTTNDFVQLCVPWQVANTPSLVFNGFPSNDTVWVRCTNNRTNAAVDPVAAVVRVMVTKAR